jgi:L-lactate utilization protein LutC
MSVVAPGELRRFAEAFAPLVECGGVTHGAVRACATPAEAAGWLALVLREQQAQRVLAASRPELAAVVALLRRELDSLTVIDPSAPPSLQQMAELDAGLGGADLLVAESASLILTRSLHEPWALSLLPRVHLVVTEAGRIVPRLADALSRLPAGDFTMITGPSRTADVEKTLVVPAHGPAQLFVAILP